MIGFFEYQFLSYKKKQLRNLVALAKVDGHFHEDEKALIYKLGQKYGLKEKQTKRILDSNKKTKVFIPKSDNDKMDHLFDLLQMVYADGIVDEHEVHFCKDVVHSFGYKESLVDRLIEIFKNTNIRQEDWDQIKKNLIKEYS